MTWFWVGIAVLLVAVAPLLVLVLTRALRPAIEIRRHAAALARSGGLSTKRPGADGELVRMRELLQEVRRELERYGAALDELRRRP